MSLKQTDEVVKTQFTSKKSEKPNSTKIPSIEKPADVVTSYRFSIEKAVTGTTKAKKDEEVSDNSISTDSRTLTTVLPKIVIPISQEKTTKEKVTQAVKFPSIALTDVKIFKGSSDAEYSKAPTRLNGLKGEVRKKEMKEKERRRKRQLLYDTIPGPNAYRPVPCYLYKPNSANIACSLSWRTKIDFSKKNDHPAPNAYDVTEGWKLIKPQAPRYSLRVKHAEGLQPLKE